MRLTIYSDVNEFYNSTYNLYMRHEAQNLIPLGNVIMGKEGKDKSGWRDPSNWFMAVVSDDNGALLAALMTPPHNMTLYAKNNAIDEAAVQCLLAGIMDTVVPGVIARKDIAKYFAQTYCSAKGMSYETSMDQRIYELTDVNPDIPDIGKMRLADERDMYFLPYWIEAFNSASDGADNPLMRIPQDAAAYLYRVEQKKLYVLEDDGMPVSIAGMTRELQTVCGVAQVYTPPYLRKKGYATSCVAKLSRIILERGFTKCVLYTDLANPISNSIYQKIGYRPICDSLMLKFV